MARVLNKPQPARVRLDPARPEGMPAAVNGEAVESLRESWLVEDRWWTPEPLRRRYWELVGKQGRNMVVFHDLCSGRWFVQ
jgi:CO dehydrogenase/acetyl-CoA synthase delta subunit